MVKKLKIVSFECKKCNFKTKNKKDYNRHLKTLKSIIKIATYIDTCV